MAELSLLLAFGAGVLSFASPCNVPLYPAFISYITGISVEDLQKEEKALPPRAILHTIFFLVGFSTIFVVLGLSTSAISVLFQQYNDFVRQMGAIFIVIFGLVILGILNPTLFFKNKQWTFKNKPTGFLGSGVIGLGFAAGWTPCVGPILASVMALSVASPGSGMLHMVVYSLGFSIPFFVMTFFVGKLSVVRKYHVLITKAGGSIMIGMGIVLFFDWMTPLTSLLVNYVFDGFMGF